MWTALVGYGLKAQPQEGEQKGLEAWAGAWARPLRVDPETSSTPNLSRKAEKIPAYRFLSQSYQIMLTHIHVCSIEYLMLTYFI